MYPLLNAAQMREADRYAMEVAKIDSLQLMENAANAVVWVIKEVMGDALKRKTGLILAGAGNNGGDALAVARLLNSHGLAHLYVWMETDKELSVDCKTQLDRLKTDYVDWTDAPPWEKIDFVVDGLFGTGLKRAIEGKAAQVIADLNAQKKTVFSADLPSGLNANTGTTLGPTVKATHTITFGFHKKGLVTGEAAEWVGQVHFDGIQIPQTIPGIEPSAYWYTQQDAKEDLPPRKATGHKNTYGHLYIWVGQPEMEGAAALASVAGFRAGSGLISLIGDRSIDSVRQRLPIEVMAKALNAYQFPEKMSALVLGPGMGTATDRWKWIQAAFSTNAPLVLDADALTLLAQNQSEAMSLIDSRPAPVFLTPHPKEAARLLGETVESIQTDRYRAVEALQKNYGCFVLLKGKGTLVKGPSSPVLVVTAGDGSLSKAGSGDVLSGILGSLLGQGVSVERVGALAAYVHGRAAERLTAHLGTQRSAMASELTDYVPGVWVELDG